MATTDDSLPDGFSNPNQGQGDEEQDATVEPGDEYRGMYLGISDQGEGEFSPWYIAKIKTEDGVERVFAKGDFKAAITGDRVEVGDTIYYAAADEKVETDEYGEILPITFGVQ